MPGFQRPRATVFAGLYPTEEAGYEALDYAMERFLLQDGSVSVEKERSDTLGRGLRCGFHGLLHLEVVQQRLEQEHGVEVVLTSPTVPMYATLTDGSTLTVNSPAALPEARHLRELREPLVRCTLLTPAEYLGPLISLCEKSDGERVDQSYIGADRVMLRYVLPLAEVATEFYDRVKTISSGYASVDFDEASTCRCCREHAGSDRAPAHALG